jgi:hypothetical protein
LDAQRWPHDDLEQRFVVILPGHTATAVALRLAPQGKYWRVVEASPTISVDIAGVLGGAQLGMAGKDAKPVIYLYPQVTQRAHVSLSLAGRLTHADPATTCPDGWDVTAHPDGTIVTATGGRYPYLFWEATAPTAYDVSTGFVVRGSETGAFLQGALARLGLTDSERREFLSYWLPRMEHNAYNLVHFEGPVYERSAKLDVSPRPDTMIRVFMVWKPLERPVSVTPQRLSAPRRSGFTVVEWGGAEIDR